MMSNLKIDRTCPHCGADFTYNHPDIEFSNRLAYDESSETLYYKPHWQVPIHVICRVCCDTVMFASPRDEDAIEIEEC